MKTIYLPELAALSAQELNKLIKKIKREPDSPAKKSLLTKLNQLKTKQQ